MSSETPTNIDAVILWVDGKDENHQSKMIPYLKDKSVLKSKKFRTRYDQVDEIKFTIDSILKYATYIRNIFIVTDNQIPNFLKDEDPLNIYHSVSIVDHRDIFKEHQQYLPTFNCRPIESCIYNIPNLAEHFIYFNDDFFLINETSPKTFFRNGLPILRGKWDNFDEDKLYKKFKKKRLGHKNAQQNAAKLLGFKKYYHFRHTPHPLRKSTFKNYFEEFPEVLVDNIKHKFRVSSQFTPQGLANHLEIKNETCFFERDLNLMYFRSYKKPLIWYKFKLNFLGRNKLFLGLQSLDHASKEKLDYIISWLEKRFK